jgi:hypothetical protein
MLDTVKLTEEQRAYEFGSDCLGCEMKWLDYLFATTDTENLVPYWGTDLYSTVAGVFNVPRHLGGKQIKNFYTHDIVNNHDCLCDALRQALIYVDLIRYSNHDTSSRLDLIDQLSNMRRFFLENGSEMNICHYF